jgi:hypothetical protein
MTDGAHLHRRTSAQVVVVLVICGPILDGAASDAEAAPPSGVPTFVAVG